MISLLEIAQNMNEADVDDDKIIKYKDKEGESQEMTAGAAKKQPDDHPAKQAWNKMAGDGGDGEKDLGGKLGKGDFDRDGGGDDNVKSDDEEISDANSGPIDTDDIMDMLKKDPEVVDKMGDDVYWDGMDLVSSKFDDDTIASIPDDSNMTLGDLKKQIMDYEGEEDDENEFSGPNPDDSENLEDAEETVAYYEDELNHHQERLESAQDVLDDALRDPENAKDDIRRAKELLAKSTRGIEFNINKLKDANEKVKSFGGGEKDESIKVIDGKKYKAIKESKKNPRILKEIYDRTFRSLK